MLWLRALSICVFCHMQKHKALKYWVNVEVVVVARLENIRREFLLCYVGESQSVCYAVMCYSAVCYVLWPSPSSRIFNVPAVR